MARLVRFIDRWTELREKILEDLTTVTVAELADVESKRKQ